MKKRYWVLKRVSVILILFVLFTKMHAQKVPTNNIPKLEISAEKLLIASAICFFILYPLFLYFRESKRKRATQRELIREKELLSLLLEKSDIYTWKYVESTNTFSCDKEFFEHLDMPFRTFTLQEMTEAIHPEDRTDVLATFYRIKTQPDSKTHTQCRYNFNGKGYIWYELRYANPTETMSESASIIGLITNIQHFKDKEEELMKAKDLAIEAELKQSFLANMSHEIRTPLNAIVGFSSILSEYIQNEDMKEYVHIIEENNQLLLQLINDILDISRIEAGILEFVEGNMNVNDTLHEIYTTVKLKITSDIDIRFLPGLEQCIIHTIPKRVKQVINNYVSNAIKHTPKGYIDIGYNVPQEGKIRFFVRDTGTGIPAEKQKHIFERFVKLDSFKQGTGLGLSICTMIAERMNGEIGVNSVQGKGSEFWFKIPYTPVEAYTLSQ